MAEHEVRQVGILLNHHIVEELLVLHHGVRARVAPVTPRVVGDSRGTMSHVVVGSNDESCVHKGNDHVEVPARMLAEAVHQLNDARRLARRHIDPTSHLIATVARRKLNFMQHKSSPRRHSRAGRPAPMLPLCELFSQVYGTCWQTFMR